jgi:hypothetical protein
MKKPFLTMLALLLMVFATVQAAIYWLTPWMAHNGVDKSVVTVANAGLFFLSLVAALMHLSGSRSKDPFVFYRMMMLATLMKLFLCALAVVVYVYMAGKARNNAGVYAAMVIYALYTIVEVSTALQMSNRKDEENKRAASA